MKTLRALLNMTAVVLSTAGYAWAVDTTQTYQSGIMVLLFLGVVALIIVAQMVPALILMMGTISAFAKKVTARKKVAVTDTGREIIE
ncbi:MAG: hypothetical protein P1S46_01580 [bacterium]|nr:hypothetical protein [bacterium]MDT8395168.1 hypothetical protein [bacterium]